MTDLGYTIPVIKGPQSEDIDGPVFYIHIGMAKSGTKWVQKIFSSNSSLLEKYRIHYPLPKDETGEIDQQETFNLNAEKLFDPNADVDDFWKTIHIQSGSSLLVSNENIFSKLIKLLYKDQQKLNEYIESILSKNFSKIHFFVVFRDPIEYRISLWSQFVKMGKSTLQEFEQFFFEHKKPLGNLNHLAEFVKSQPRCTLTLLNYDTIKDDYYKPLETWLDLPIGTLHKIANKQINRSLNYTELYCISKLQKVPNINIGKLTYKWITDLKDISSDKLFPSQELQNKFLKRQLVDIDKLNKKLSTEHRLYPKIHEPFNRPEKLVFTTGQMDILINHLSQMIEAQNQEKKELLLKRNKNKKKRIGKVFSSFIQQIINRIKIA